MLIVTAFINLKESYAKTPKFRLEQFQKLAETNVPILIFASPEYVAHLPENMNVQVVPYDFDVVDDRALPLNRTEGKDTRKFLQLMNLKVEFMKIAIEVEPSFESYAWIDFNVFHVVKDVTTVQRQIQRISSSQIEGFHIPGCWDAGLYSVDKICWRFCGGFFVGDAGSIKVFIEQHEKIKIEKLTWEVNVWALMEQNGWKPAWYKGDHDDSLFQVPFLS